MPAMPIVSGQPSGSRGKGRQQQRLTESKHVLPGDRTGAPASRFCLSRSTRTQNRMAGLPHPPVNRDETLLPGLSCDHRRSRSQAPRKTAPSLPASAHSQDAPSSRRGSDRNPPPPGSRQAFRPRGETESNSSSRLRAALPEARARRGHAAPDTPRACPGEPAAKNKCARFFPFAARQRAEFFQSQNRRRRPGEPIGRLSASGRSSRSERYAVNSFFPGGMEDNLSPPARCCARCCCARLRRGSAPSRSPARFRLRRCLRQGIAPR